MNKSEILSILPSGWKESRSSNGDLERTGEQSRLKSGDLSLLLKKHLGSKLRFNQLTKIPEISDQEIPEETFDYFHVALSEDGWDISSANAKDALLYAAMENKYHPVKEYLDLIAQDSKVTPVDIDRIAEIYLNTQDPLSNAMLASTLVGAVARVMEPGIKFDCCTVLKGEQGIGKSSFWQALASPAYFTDTPQESAKDMQLLIHTTWFIELAELESITGKKEASQLRIMLSSAKDAFRAPYGATIKPHKRQSIFVGSVNPDCFLRDREGNRRFLVIDLPNKRDNKIDIDKVTTDRDAIWKSAVLAYRSGRLPILTYDECELSEQRNAQYVSENIFVSEIENWLLKRNNDDVFTIHDAIVGSNIRDSRSIKPIDQQHAADALKQLGCISEGQQRINGKRGRFWRAPPNGRFDPDDRYVVFLSDGGEIEVLSGFYPGEEPCVAAERF